MINRRVFFKQASMTAALLSSPSLFASSALLQKDEIYSTLSAVQDLIFPLNPKLDIDDLSYLKLILSHSKIKDEDKDFIINSASWLNETSLEKHALKFIDLDQKTKSSLINFIISSTNWGESFIYDMLTYCTEAAFSDPVYRASLDEQGWKWIGHESGLPMPKYPFL